MFRKTKELQSLVNTSRNALKEAESKIENRNMLIVNLQNKNAELTEENKDLRFKNEEQKELIDRITRVATANAYNNEKVILSKIKELVNDHQSIN